VSGERCEPTEASEASEPGGLAGASGASGAGPGLRAPSVTYGCQMNEADSAEIRRMLLGRGFSVGRDERQSDLVLLNTCTVRRKAEEKVFGKLGHLKALKKARPGLVIGVLGCMGASSRDEIEAEAPWVDFVLPPHRIETLAQIVDIRFPGRVPGETGEDLDPSETPFKAYVNISRGCDNSCTFCIVPMVRGREVSFPYEEIHRQVAHLEQQGVLEVCLLGQNVNSYRHSGLDFAGLLDRLAAGFPRLKLRFTSPHPKDFPDRLIEVLARHDNIAKQVHLPLQSGSDRVLRVMKRGYNVHRFLDRVEALRRLMPGITLSTDVICGFPGETDDDFATTLSVMRQVRFDHAYMFYYSPRQGTEAVALPGHLPVHVRKARLRRLIDVQLPITLERNQRLVGRLETVLLERAARRPAGCLVGRTDGNKLVIVPAIASLVGTYRGVRITGADGVTLFGELDGGAQRAGASDLGEIESTPVAGS
jgi:tRNA-2-methylthio-N6-dimethylallyladenosine synthase